METNWPKDKIKIETESYYIYLFVNERLDSYPKWAILGKHPQAKSLFMKLRKYTIGHR